MHGYVQRNLYPTLLKRLDSFPAVALLGARQVGKSTIAKQILEKFKKTIYLDLERPSDLNKLTDAENFLRQFHDHLICFDEIQRVPELFPVLRSVIDTTRRNGQFLILGSASRELIRQSSETLAGRISYLPVTPFNILEVPGFEEPGHWVRGGYPESFLAKNDDDSVQWRADYIRTFLERDIPLLGFNLPANTLSRFWRMLAHVQGQVLNASKIADSMGISSHTARKYIDLLEQTFVLRTLSPYETNTKKRVIKSPKIFIRDSGLLHTLLDLDSMEDLFSHPVYGSSYEGYVIENILSTLHRWRGYFYRTSNGAEVDLILLKGMKTIAIEIKSSQSPKPSKGFWNFLESEKPFASYVIAPVQESYPLKGETWVLSLQEFLNKMTNPIERIPGTP